MSHYRIFMFKGIMRKKKEPAGFWTCPKGHKQNAARRLWALEGGQTGSMPSDRKLNQKSLEFRAPITIGLTLLKRLTVLSSLYNPKNPLYPGSMLVLSGSFHVLTCVIMRCDVFQLFLYRFGNIKAIDEFMD